MAGDERSGEQPMYGPPMSPAIFTRKWLDKFEHFFMNFVTQRPVSTALTSMQWMCVLCAECVAHVTMFHWQANEIVLANPDFVPVIPSEAEKATITENWHSAMQKRGGFTSKDLVAVWNRNPFSAAQMVVRAVDPFALRLKEIKYGGRFHGLPWQSLPLQDRKTMNEVFVIMEQGEKAGWWQVTAAERKSGSEQLKLEGW